MKFEALNKSQEFTRRMALFCKTHELVVYSGLDGQPTPAISRLASTLDYAKTRHQREHPECTEFIVKTLR